VIQTGARVSILAGLYDHSLLGANELRRILIKILLYDVHNGIEIRYPIVFTFYQYYTTYLIGDPAFGRAVHYLLLYFVFCALRAQKRNADKIRTFKHLIIPAECGVWLATPKNLVPRQLRISKVRCF
jgi:hypothetical protein